MKNVSSHLILSVSCVCTLSHINHWVGGVQQDDFFRQLFRFSENGDEQKLCDLLNAWPASVKQRGAWETLKTLSIVL